MSKLIEMMNSDVNAANAFVFAMFNAKMENELEETADYLDGLEPHQIDELHYNLDNKEFVSDVYFQFTNDEFPCSELPKFEIPFDQIADFVTVFNESSEYEREEFLNEMRDNVIAAYLSNEESMKLYNETTEIVADYM